MYNVNLDIFVQAVNDKNNVTGFTHDFYNYPARFSPLFIRETIKTFTKPGDLVMDPFMGGGTTLVEAKLLNRNAVGFDISSLAHFVTGVKTSTLTVAEIKYINKWFDEVIQRLNCKINHERPEEWIEKGYQKNLSDKTTWPIRKLIEQFLYEIENSKTTIKIKNFLRCALLKTGQWALDSTKEIPSADDFRTKLASIIKQMSVGAKEFMEEIEKHDESPFSLYFNKPAIEIPNEKKLKSLSPPKLVLTSPPYPGIHVVYHRWQIHGKRETPAPFWIANSLDGHGLTHYAMGGRKQKGLTGYFSNIQATFSAISQICDRNTLIVQVLAFSEPDWQLPRYLEVMSTAGFKEAQPFHSRLWREVPNRKWYAQNKGKTNSSNEVILFHKLA